jgi:Glycogen recognition site of AMP-activated protein kinase
MTETYHLLVKRLLDGELSLSDLPLELRGEGAEALRLLGAVDRAPVALSAQLEARVMAEVRRRARSPLRRLWHGLVEPRDIELRLRLRPWVVWGAALAAAAAVALLLTRPSQTPEGARPVRLAERDSVYVRFVLYAPTARRVAVAGTFNQWDQNASPLVRVGGGGVWAITLALPQGHHQYAFVVDGGQWVPDPAAPGVDDGFGRRNSMVAVTARGARIL